jgi:DNA-binding NtrC family response regulator
LITDWLGSDGLECHVTWVQCRDDFAAALRAQELDLILADYSLPGFGGIEALDLAHEVLPSVPFIFVSGHLGEELAIETLKRGATDYVLKGRLERLLPSVKRAMREAHERAERQRMEATLRILSEASLVLSSLDYTTTLGHVARLRPCRTSPTIASWTWWRPTAPSSASPSRTPTPSRNPWRAACCSMAQLPTATTQSGKYLSRAARSS